jgi:hypothetical protein
MHDEPASLYTRLGGYHSIAAVVDDLLARLRSDDLLSRWRSRLTVSTFEPLSSCRTPSPQLAG